MLLLENIPILKVKTIELLQEGDDKESLLSPKIISVLNDQPLIQPDINVLSPTQNLDIPGVTFSNNLLSAESDCLLVIAKNIIENAQTISVAFKALIPGGFLLVREPKNFDVSKLNLSNIEIILHHYLDNEEIILLRKYKQEKLNTVVDISANIDNLEWLPTLQKAVKSDPNTIVYSQSNEISGAIGLVNCLRREPSTSNVRCLLIIDKDAPKFNLNKEFYRSQLRKGLAMNVFKDGEWGKLYRSFLVSSCFLDSNS